MDIILINVPFVLGISKTINRNTPEEIEKWINAVGYAPPLGLGYIYSFLKEKNIDVGIIDLSYISIFDENKFKNQITAANPMIVGLSFSTHSRLSVIKMIQLIRECLPKTHITVGGHHVTSAPQQSINTLDINSIIIGDGEEALYNLYCDLKDNKSNQNYTKHPGLIYKEYNSKYENGYSYALTDDIDTLPWPQRSIFDNDKYTLRFPRNIYNFDIPKKVDYIITSRGCPFACRFCSTYLTHGKKTTRFRNIINVVDEIEYLIKERGIDGLFIYDDNFIINKKRIQLFADEMKRRKLFIPFKIWARADTIDFQSLKALKDVGLSVVSFGMESGSNRILEYYNKKLTTKESINAIKITNQLDIIPIATFIVGAPIETVKDVLETYSLILRLKVCNPKLMFSISLFGLYIYPGTGIYYDALNDGVLPSDFNWYYDNPSVASLRGAPIYQNDHIQNVLKTAKHINNLQEKLHLNSIMTQLGNIKNNIQTLFNRP